VLNDRLCSTTLPQPTRAVWVSDDISRNGCEAALFVSRTVNEIEKTVVDQFEPERPGLATSAIQTKRA
jgi:hypothetical protein